MFLLVAALMSTAMSFGQNTLVATLNHEDNVTMFYGIGAFQSAHNAAESGDVITLSGGSFTGFSITKAVTVRGTGIDVNFPTRVSSRMEINIPENDTGRFSVEGVRFDNTVSLYGSFSNPYFLKCQLSNVTFEYGSSKYSSITNALFINCKITQSILLGGSTTASFSHCYVNDCKLPENQNSEAQFVNCVLFGDFENYHRSTFVNCILTYYKQSTACFFSADALAMNCVAIYYGDYGYSDTRGYKYNMYDKMQGNQISCAAATFEEVFKDFRPNKSYGVYSDSQTFELTEEAKTRFSGSDGTEVGLYGGANPYNSTPAYPRITKFNVAKQSTADDKLSVEIEVSAAE